MQEPAGIIGLIHHPVHVLGPGSRLGIWFQGCSRRCPECLSPHTWDPAAGPAPLPLSRLVQTLRGYAGLTGSLTISGGEPWEQQAFLAALLREARAIGFEDILVYTGFTLEELRRDHPEPLAWCDVLIDGAYRADLPTRLLFRGSANQRMHVFSERSLIRVRYSPLLTMEEDRPRVQLIRKEGRTVLIGIPRDDLRGIVHGH